MSDEFTFGEAVRERVSLLLGLGGPSGSGKTLSALKIARGLAGNDSKIFAIDTEQGRMLHYACAPGEVPGPFKFKFRYMQLVAPFTPERYATAIMAAEKAGAEVIIVDSMSHEHEGIGGILESHEAQLTKMAGTDFGRREAMKFAAWIEPKKKHNKLVNVLLQRKPHLIFCFRAKDKLKMIRNAKGKMEPVNIGWTAICSDQFEYEMTMLLMLPPNSKGVPDLSQPQNKINEEHRAFIKAEKPIDESLGKALAAWAAGGVAPAPKPKSVIDAETPAETPAETTQWGVVTSVDGVPTRAAEAMPHDPETGEVVVPGSYTVYPPLGAAADPKPDIFPPSELPPPSAEEVAKVEAWANKKIKQFDTVTEASFIDDWLEAQKDALARVNRIAPEAVMAVVAAADMRKKQLEGGA